MKWEFKNGIPIYLQIIDQIKRQIVSGELAPGSRIPAVRDLAKEAGVNPNTMQRALTQLEQEGLLYTQRTSGRFVTQEEEIMKQTRMQLSDEYIAELFKHLQQLGLSRDDIVKAVSEWRDNSK
ncbi:MAG TPA: GntR family transcriptional regulator [Lachnospiraceae bacterium]|nr:GntR family transcriptional regulator [Lachnospiraceae bacterium]HAP72178.1 GntR family transcriptional regulator [Lachnospiraceae bacterium]